MTFAKFDAGTSSERRYAVIGTELSEDVLFNGEDVIKGLSQTPKIISPIYYYDDRGSALFEELCEEPTYYLSRTERKIIVENAAEIASVTGSRTIVELGCGNGAKTGEILSAFSRQYGSVHYVPVDINQGILLKAGANLTATIPGLTVNGIVGTYQTALADLATDTSRKCILFLGSSVGNLDDEELASLVESITATLAPGDQFIVGLDLDKDSGIVEAAYNNQTAILTNFAVLAHLNWRFEGDFDLFRYRHLSFHNRELERMETHVVATEAHEVHLKRLNFKFTVEKGERIRTEIMRKFVLPTFTQFMADRQLQLSATWKDEAEFYALCLFTRQ